MHKVCVLATLDSLYLSEVICQLDSVDEVAELLERCQATTSTSANEVIFCLVLGYDPRRIVFS